MSKQARRQAELERSKQKTRILIISSIALVVILFAALFILASKDSGSDNTSGKAVGFNYSDLPRLGSEDAPVKIVEFGDFKCPACAEFTGVIKPQIVDEYVTPGKAAFYFVNMSFVGPDSETASLAALSVYHQNNDEFWKYYDAMYARQGKEDEEWAAKDYLVNLAKELGLTVDTDVLAKDIENKTYADELQRDNQLASDSGVTTTPSVFVNGVKIAEPFNYQAITQQIDTAAKEAASQ
ncbi:DsbA family protein [Paenibacillus sp. sgz500958]|uniref:DsbA family protein n=1 Tax=Paenibacillus sp. sgz500958 TaxID=3242475 RepID=UPI0036D43090